MTEPKSVAITGSGGFLGWHTRVALRETNTRALTVKLGDGFEADVAAVALSGADRVVHLAGVNRGTDAEVADGNRRLAEQLAWALRDAVVPPKVVVYANSIQSSNGTVYGEAKAAAGETLARAAAEVGADFRDVPLPNLFGEHGAPFYNSVTATFCHLLAAGETPLVENDRELKLLHAQDAAELLVGPDPKPLSDSTLVHETVSGLLRRLSEISRIYSDGEIPDISEPSSRDLFNTYRSFAFPQQAPFRLARHADARGAFFETVRSRGGTAQTSFSTTAPGVTRGDHFHRRKVERFVVIDGKATISLRRLFSRELLRFEVSGDEPVAIDMPTMWAHSIVNTGTSDLLTAFWTNDIFDPSNPDTIAEKVVQ